MTTNVQMGKLRPREEKCPRSVETQSSSLLTFCSWEVMFNFISKMPLEMWGKASSSRTPLEVKPWVANGTSCLEAKGSRVVGCILMLPLWPTLSLLDFTSPGSSNPMSCSLVCLALKAEVRWHSGWHGEGWALKRDDCDKPCLGQ